MPDAAPMSAIFEPRPRQWGLRGDVHVWAGMRECLGDLAVPTDSTEGVGLLHQAFRAVVGVDLATSTDDRVFREEFDSGGMSSGLIDLATWRDRLMPLLEDRVRTLAATQGSDGLDFGFHPGLHDG